MALSDYSGLIGSGVGAIGNYFSSQNVRDATRAEANANLQSSQNALEIAKINQQTALAQLQSAQGSGNAPGKSNTALYIGLGVGGVLVLGLVIFVATRNK